jgi:aspartyl-tRNA(Asn)/glutamyl-tRNA(Gln) amidotransferase subunit C
MNTPSASESLHVEKLSKLAHIALDPSEKQRVAEKLASVFQWISQMDHLSLEDTPVESSPCPMRCDGPAVNESSDDILSNAPLKDQQFFVVPRVLE